jgi:hypothetical protein
MKNIVGKTFTEPLSRVKRATLDALREMAVDVRHIDAVGTNTLIIAQTDERVLEIELEPVSAKVTYMRSIVRRGMLLEGETAAEVIMQTEKALAFPKRSRSRVARPAGAL